MKMPKYEVEIWHARLIKTLPSKTEYAHFYNTIEEAQKFLQKQYLITTKGFEVFGLVEKKHFFCKFDFSTQWFYAFVYVKPLDAVTTWCIKPYKGEGEK